LPAALQVSGKKSPGRILAQILGKPEQADKISLFASGDQGRLGGLLSLQKSSSDEEKRRRLSCSLGYWLWDSILRFPGVVLNEIAVASYLDLDHQLFRDNEDVERLFSSARYNGPFALAKPPLWWRTTIDEILSSNDCASGRQYVQCKLQFDPPRSKCCENPDKSAGYYCFLSERPVSLENSKPGLAWFPRGADLARISVSKFEELAPWL
jgi:hypothetical protein